MHGIEPARRQDRAGGPALKGLSAGEAAKRLAAEGPNALPAARGGGWIGLVAGLLREPMFLLLVAAAGVYFLLGDLREALALAASIGVVAAITIVQEWRTERALEALRDLSSPRALVVRDGREMRIAGRDVVRGDVLLLREGDRVAADARLAEAHGLAVDESLLTGESAAATKHAGAADAEGQVHSGTLVVRGTAVAEVTATGPRTELGRIGRLLADEAPQRSRLQGETAAMVRVFAAGAGVLCIGVTVAYAWVHHDLLGGVLSGLTLAMALLPEEFPVVLTIFLALGAWRIAKHGVLTRRMPAIETLGAATVLCCDKTGTLTENRMRVASVWDREAWRAPAEGHAAILEAAALASEPRPHDPMERAVHEAFALRDPGALEHRYPLRDALLAVTHGWLTPAGARRAAMKGAPEAVLDACNADATLRSAVEAAAQEAAARGQRVLGVAEALPGSDAPWPRDARELPLRFLGLVALEDPLRASVPAAVALCRKAGIRVVMITGDHPATALAIAREAGLDATGAITGAQLEGLADGALAAKARATQVFARVRPEQKLRLVRALRATGEVVAMTGDGVNDAPALRAADIGIAMGRRGTDVAREAAALVLLEDDFTAIVGTIRLGRRIDENLANAMRYLVAAHVPLAGMAFLALAAGLPPFFYPLHVVFLEFVIDPACSIVFEAERSEADAMERPPRDPHARLFGKETLLAGFALGAGVLAVVAATYALALHAGLGEALARALGFAALVGGNLGLIASNRSFRLPLHRVLARGNPAMWAVAAATLAALAAVLFVPPLASLFRFEVPPPGLAAAALVAGLASVLWIEPFKRLAKV